jgi:site-specific DNA-methyltransferase (adenine-specific)
MNPVHFSTRKKDDWGTPNWVYDSLDAEFDITLDVCADSTNAKCAHFFSREVDGLSQDWGQNRCWMNPPYSKLRPWLEKAYLSSLAGATVVCLIPARTDTRAWHLFCSQAYEIRLIKGRIRFVGATNSAPFPSAIVVFKPRKRNRRPRYRHVDLREVQRSLSGC